MKVPAKFREGIARYRADDAADLKDFQLREFGEGTRQVDEGRSRWLFEQNPASLDDGWDLWICRRDGAIVGQQGEVPFVLRVGGREHQASWAIDLRVDDAWRLRGVGPGLVATLLEARSIVAAMNMSDKGFTLMERSGWTDLGVVPVYLRPLHLDRAADIAPVRPKLRRMLGPATPVLNGADRLAMRGIRLAGMSLEPTDRFDQRSDEVWDHAQASYPVLARRDLDVLSWLIDQRPDRNIMQRYYLRRRRQTVGYVVLRMAGNERDRTAVVVDYLAPPRLVAPLLLAVAAAARDQGAIALSVKTRNAPADRYLRAAGFLRRDQGADTPIRFMVHCTDEAPDVCAELRSPDSWFVTSADCDLEYGMTPR